MEVMRYTMYMLRRLASIGIPLLIAVLLIAGSAGVPHFGMDMTMDGNMGSNCFMPGMSATLCQMNPLEHLAAWQGVFVAVPSMSSFLLLLSILLALVLGRLLTRLHHTLAPPKLNSLEPLTTYYKQYVPIPNQLQEAFSNGILNPKVF